MVVNRSPDMAKALEAAVQHAGSQSALARILGVSQRAVWRWVKLKRPLPAEHVLKVEEATGVSRYSLRPDIYGPDEGLPRQADIADGVQAAR